MEVRLVGHSVGATNVGGTRARARGAVSYSSQGLGLRVGFGSVGFEFGLGLDPTQERLIHAGIFTVESCPSQ